MVRFKAGDIVEIVNYWNQDTELFEDGVVLIIDHNTITNYTKTGAYLMRLLKGSFSSCVYNSHSFDNLPYLVWLGNINENKALRLLYGA